MPYIDVFTLETGKLACNNSAKPSYGQGIQATFCTCCSQAYPQEVPCTGNLCDLPRGGAFAVAKQVVVANRFNRRYSTGSLAETPAGG
jgi:hypothetical protein